MESIGVGIIGTGDISGSHVESYRSIDDKVRVLAICDTDAQRCERILSEYEVQAHVYSDYRKLLDREDISLVSICLPNAMHASVTVEALRAGKHVLCEKPIACSLAEVDQICQATNQTGKHAFSVFQNRYGIGYRTLKKLVERGATGRLYSGSVDVGWIRDSDYYSGWRGTWEHEMGGCLVTLAIHAIDAFLGITGQAKSLFAQIGCKGHAIETEDVATITGVFEKDDAYGCIQATSNNVEEVTCLKFVFDNMTIVSSTAAYAWAEYPWRFLHKDEDKQRQLDELVVSLGHQEGKDSSTLHSLQIRDIVRFVQEGGPLPEVTIEEARKSIEFITRAYMSAKTGQAIRSAVSKESPFYSRMHGDFHIPGATKR